MATKKVSALSALTSPDGAEELLINDGGTSKKITITNVSKLNLKGGDLTSADPLVIDTDGNYFDVTGTTNFAAMTVAANRQFTLQFDGILTMTHHATNLDLPSEANITTAAGDVATFQSTGANTVQCINYTRAAGTAIVAGSTSTATSSATGVIKIEDDTEQTVAANTVSATAGKTYGIQLNSSDQAVVNVPWTDTDTVYTLPEANATTKGGIELFSNTDQSVAAESVSTTANRTYGLQLNSDGQGVVNVPWADTDTDTTYSAGSSSALGLIKLEDDATQTTAASAITTTSSRTYGLQINGSGQGVVNVPWTDTDTNTTYTAGDGLDLSTAEFSVDLKSSGGLAIDSTELKLDLSQDQSWSGSQRGTPSTVTDGTLDLDTANNFEYTPATNPDALEFSNETAGQSGFIKVINASGKSITTGSEVKKGSSWDVSTAGTYLVSYYCDGTSVYVSASEALSS